MRLADTNILIYAADTSPEERHNRARAAEVLKEDDLCLSVQVLQEFYHQATRPKGRLRMTHEQSMVFLEPFMGLPNVPVTQELFRRAAQVAERYGISYGTRPYWRRPEFWGATRSTPKTSMTGNHTTASL